MPSPWAIIAALVAVLAAFGGGWYGRGQWDEGRAAVVQAGQQTEAATAVKEQHHGIVQAEIRYVDRVKLVDRAMPVFTVEFMSRCLRDGGAADLSTVPGSATDSGSDRARTDASARRWCERVAENYARGQRNTERLILLREGVSASGGSEP